MAMQGRGNAINLLVVLASALLATLLLQTGTAEAKNHNVGGTKNWDYPAVADLGYYDKWSAQQKFHPGDTLSKWPSPSHLSCNINSLFSLGWARLSIACRS